MARPANRGGRWWFDAPSTGTITSRGGGRICGRIQRRQKKREPNVERREGGGGGVASVAPSNNADGEERIGRSVLDALLLPNGYGYFKVEEREGRLRPRPAH